jgi:hypothetical protein
MTAVKVDGSAVTQPVSDGGGSITVDGTVAATQSGTWTARIQDGSGNALTSKAPGTERALSVAIVDGSGNQVTSFGGSGGTSQSDDAPFTVASSSLTPVGGTYRASLDSVDDGDAGAFAMTQKRALYVSSLTPAGDSAMDDTADAVKVLQVDSTGTAVATAVSATTDTITAKLATDAIMSGTTALTPKFKNVAVAASQTDSSVIASVASKKLRVLAAFVQCGATATDATFESDDAVTDTTVWKVTLGANGGAVLPFNPVGWFETDSGEALIVTTSAGSTVQIMVTYVEV